MENTMIYDLRFAKALETKVPEFSTEEQFQAFCYQWFWNAFPEERRTLFHVQQKARNAAEGSRFKAMGVVKGPSDLVFAAREGRTIYIELKLPGRTQSPEQKDFEFKVKERGHLYFVVDTFGQFVQLIKKFIF